MEMKQGNISVAVVIIFSIILFLFFSILGSAIKRICNCDSVENRESWDELKEMLE